MNYSYNTIKNIELEISTYCNAACPQCVRNNFGGSTISNLPLINWTLEKLQQILTVELVKQLDMVYFCGTYGDPMANAYIVNMCKWLRATNNKLTIGMHTNGGLGKSKTYQDLAKYVDFIAFGIDGLEDTNHLYRRNVQWEKVIKNARSFIQSGGRAVWDFIVFEHNEHQVEQAQQLSVDIGFQEFNVKKTGRFFNKAHKLVDSVNVLDKNGNKEYTLKLPKNSKYINSGYNDLYKLDFTKYVKTTNIHCYWMHNNMVYVGADGYVFPCGFLHDRLYGVESQQTQDYKKILEWIQDVGEISANAFLSSLEYVINGPWFKKIQESWVTGPLERCAFLCGEHVNLLSSQNSTIKYKIDLHK